MGREGEQQGRLAALAAKGSAVWVGLCNVEKWLKSTECARQRLLWLQGKVGVCLQQGAATRSSCQPLLHVAPQSWQLWGFTAMSGQRCWAGVEGKERNYGPQTSPCAGQGATAGTAAREEPNSAALWDTRQWWHQPVSVVSSTVKGILGSMSDTFKAGRQEVSWGLLWRAINSKPSKERIPNCHFQLVVKVLSRPKTYWMKQTRKTQGSSLESSIGYFANTSL